jgi:hypothetical protein
VRRDHGLQQHVLAIAIDEELHDLVVRVACHQPLAHDQPDFAGKVGIAVVDGFVLADEAAELTRDVARPCLERRVGQHLIRVDRNSRGHEEQHHQEREQNPHSAGAALAAAGRGAPTRSRRSVSDRTPAPAINTQPSQIRVM